MKSIDEKLIGVRYRYLRKAYLEAELLELNDRMERETQTLERLKRELDKESEDVDRLEHASINRLFTTLSGRSELRLEKEKADAFRAALDYKLKQQDLEFLAYQKNLLEQELKPYETLQQDYQGLLDIKRKSLQPQTLEEIRQMEATAANWKQEELELKEAMDCGKKLRSSFTYLLDHLNDLVEDTTDARSLWYPVISQEEIEEVVQEITKLNELWKRFELELQDTDISLPEQFDQDFLVKLNDYMEGKGNRKRINTSFEHLNATYSSVREVLCRLEKKEKELQYCIRDLELEIRQKIEQSE